MHLTIHHPYNMCRFSLFLKYLRRTIVLYANIVLIVSKSYCCEFDGMFGILQKLCVLILCLHDLCFQCKPECMGQITIAYAHTHKLLIICY